jgi:NAD+ kinase
MTFAVYCNSYSEVNLNTAGSLIEILEKKSHEICLFSGLEKQLKTGKKTFDADQKLSDSTNALITIGGDGTILNTLNFIYGSEIPVLGINTGRLGFLTGVAKDEIEDAISHIEASKFDVDQRALVHIEEMGGENLNSRLALNEISVLKRDSSSMITIHAELDGSFLNTYWADGLIISTATGSTAYSLSCGGPILMPGLGCFIITPIAPHNLNVRPLVIPDTSSLKLTFETRSSDLLIALDSTFNIVPNESVVEIKKAEHKLHLLRLEQYNYLETLRSKLHWGLDKRN